MYPSQGWDQGPTPCTRTRESKNNHLWWFLVSAEWGPGRPCSLYPHQIKNKSQKDLIFIWYDTGGRHKGSDRTTKRVKIQNDFWIFRTRRNERLLQSKSLLPVSAPMKTPPPRWGPSWRANCAPGSSNAGLIWIPFAILKGLRALNSPHFIGRHTRPRLFFLCGGRGTPTWRLSLLISSAMEVRMSYPSALDVFRPPRRTRRGETTKSVHNAPPIWRQATIWVLLKL